MILYNIPFFPDNIQNFMAALVPLLHLMSTISKSWDTHSAGKIPLSGFTYENGTVHQNTANPDEKKIAETPAKGFQLW